MRVTLLLGVFSSSGRMPYAEMGERLLTSVVVCCFQESGPPRHLSAMS